MHHLSCKSLHHRSTCMSTPLHLSWYNHYTQTQFSYFTGTHCHFQETSEKARFARTYAFLDTSFSLAWLILFSDTSFSLLPNQHVLATFLFLSDPTNILYYGNISASLWPDQYVLATFLLISNRTNVLSGNLPSVGGGGDDGEDKERDLEEEKLRQEAIKVRRRHTQKNCTGKVCEIGNSLPEATNILFRKRRRRGGWSTRRWRRRGSTWGRG